MDARRFCPVLGELEDRCTPSLLVTPHVVAARDRTEATWTMLTGIASQGHVVPDSSAAAAMLSVATQCVSDANVMAGFLNTLQSQAAANPTFSGIITPLQGGTGY